MTGTVKDARARNTERLQALAEQASAMLDGTETQRAAVALAALAECGWAGDAARSMLAAILYDDESVYLHGLRASASIKSPWAVWAAGADGTEDRREDLEEFRGRLIRRAPEPAPFYANPAGVTPSTPAAESRWLVQGLIARGRIHGLSGPWGAFKTGVGDAIYEASINGRELLGRKVEPMSILTVDAENDQRDDEEPRWKALGIDLTTMGEHVYYVPRTAGVNLSDPTWREWLRLRCAERNPDLIVLDTVSALFPDTDPNDSQAVSKLYVQFLQPLADEFDTAILLYLHERKSGSSRADRADAAAGTAQWLGKAEHHLTIAPVGLLKRDGEKAERRFTLAVVKARGRAVAPTPILFDVKSTIDADGLPITMRLDLAGKTTDEDGDEVTGSLDDQILAVLAGGPLAPGALAAAVGKRDTKGKAYRNAIGRLEEAGQIVKIDGGWWALPE